MKKLSTLLFALLFAGSMAYAQDNNANVDQEGNYQTATVTQTGSSNDADVNQLTTNSGVQTAEVIQDGEGNSATVIQTQSGSGNTTPNTAFIEQIGENNMALQIENAPSYNSGQSISGFQDGHDHILIQTIASGYTASLDAHQEGNGNLITQTIMGGGHNHGEVFQHGHENEVIQHLGGSNNGYSSGVMLVEQHGRSNYAAQYYEGLGLGHYNNSELYQHGKNNNAWQTGNGRDLSSVLNQHGQNNWSTQELTGEGHTSTVNQDGMTNVSTVIQSN
jgi:hypothetical protein